MTGADQKAVAATRRELPQLASTGLIATWTGAVPGADGEVVRAGLGDAASLAVAAVSEGDDPVVLALVEPVPLSTVLPWAAVAAIHVATDTVAKEFGARAYDNFDPSDRPVLVSPELFDVAPGDRGQPATPAPDALEGFDRRIGAAACAAAVPVPKGLVETGDRIVVGLASQRSASAEEVLAVLRPILTQEPDDESLMAVGVTGVLTLDAASPVGGRRFLTDTRDGLATADERTAKALDAALDVLKAKKELKPLRDEVGLRSVKALLLFALRPDPSDAVGWAAEMPGDPLSVVAAAVLAGLREGWTRLPVTLRGGPERRRWFESHLADGATSGRPIWTVDLPAVVGELAAEPALERDAVTENNESKDGQLGLDAGTPPLTGDDPLADLKTLAATADYDDPDVARVTAAVCLKHGWEELVTTVLQVGRRPYTWTGAAVEVVGAPALHRRIAPSFVETLRDFEGRMSPEMKALAVALGAPPKPARRRKAT